MRSECRREDLVDREDRERREGGEASELGQDVGAARVAAGLARGVAGRLNWSISGEAAGLGGRAGEVTRVAVQLSPG